MNQPLASDPLASFAHLPLSLPLTTTILPFSHSRFVKFHIHDSVFDAFEDIYIDFYMFLNIINCISILISVHTYTNALHRQHFYISSYQAVFAVIQITLLESLV